MPDHNVVGVPPDANRLAILTDLWPKLCAWVQAGITRRMPTYNGGASIGVMMGVINAINALEAAGWLPAGTGVVAYHESTGVDDPTPRGLWQMMNAANEEPITQAEFDLFTSRVQALNVSRRI
jgi:hypothetical protein